MQCYLNGLHPTSIKQLQAKKLGERVNTVYKSRWSKRTLQEKGEGSPLRGTYEEVLYPAFMSSA